MVTLENCPQPQVIFLDAVGTLFGVKGGVGQVYSQIAKQFGVTVSSEKLDQAFRDCFRQSSLPAFPGVDPADLLQQEFDWWQTIAHQTFELAGARDQFQDFEQFFEVLFGHFAKADPWEVYADVRPALSHWHAQGIRMVILSNFDSRLRSVLEALDLASFFSDLILSTEVGAAKPQPEIFRVALDRVNCSPSEVWHIGDSYREDYQGAIAVGMTAIWLQRSGLSTPKRGEQSDPDQAIVSTLYDLIRH